MRKIRDAQTILGMLEGGEVAGDFSTEITDTLREMRDSVHGLRKGTAKGEVTLKLKFLVDAGGATTVDVDITSKRPKKRRGMSNFWTLSDGSLSIEHPQQHDMFAGPRETGTRTAAE